MGAYMIYGDDGRREVLHDVELETFIKDAATLSPEASYVAQALARLIEPGHTAVSD